ncbi:hypothetical protein SAMN02745124_00764 [Desulfofustis glycolicus DSM 9705]|uniref:Uncharacterized protein n=1 Tax=Desulfofustis glycolicus DSM 9705 TaxID=1121409 RepID=A0A1M5TJW2_9BACT|nr:hypothetical protein SAMN02745124_00764 [Desulfofustis glycolicus DSM 9705]
MSSLRHDYVRIVPILFPYHREYVNLIYTKITSFEPGSPFPPVPGMLASRQPASPAGPGAKIT